MNQRWLSRKCSKNQIIWSRMTFFECSPQSFTVISLSAVSQVTDYQRSQTRLCSLFQCLWLFKLSWLFNESGTRTGSTSVCVSERCDDVYSLLCFFSVASNPASTRGERQATFRCWDPVTALILKPEPLIGRVRTIYITLDKLNPLSGDDRFILHSIIVVLKGNTNIPGKMVCWYLHVQVVFP